jgi:hypothetical protein
MYVVVHVTIFSVRAVKSQSLILVECMYGPLSMLMCINMKTQSLTLVDYRLCVFM